MAASEYYKTVEKLYIAYYGRNADKDGTAYWSARLDDEGGSLTSIIDAFANSAEAQGLYGGMTNENKITTIYQQLFDRMPDTGGLNFYTEQLAGGTMTQASIMLNILDGASGDDRAKINTRVSNWYGDLDLESINLQAEAYAQKINPHVPSDLFGKYELVHYYEKYFQHITEELYDRTGNTDLSIYEYDNRYGSANVDGLFDLRLTKGSLDWAESGRSYTLEPGNILRIWNPDNSFEDNPYEINGDILTIHDPYEESPGNYAWDKWHYLGA